MSQHPSIGRKAQIKFALVAVLLSPLTMASSCSSLSDDPGEVRVIAPAGKCWSGAIGDSTKDGCGTRSFRIEGESIIVANAQKGSPGHWRLTLRLYVGDELKDTSTTTATFGVAQVSE